MHTKHHFQPQFAYKIPKIIRITISKVKKSEICYHKKKYAVTMYEKEFSRKRHCFAAQIRECDVFCQHFLISKFIRFPFVVVVVVGR